MTVIKYLKHLEYRYMMRQVCTTSFATGFLSFAHDYHQDFDRTYRLSFVYQNNSENLLWSGLFSWMCEHKDKLTELDENFQKRLKSTERMFNQFIHHFEPKQGDESFNEHTVLKYIELYYGRSATGKGRHLFSLRKLRRAYRATHGLYSNEAKDHLKDAFILHLINRQLVDDPRAGGLVHRFHIK